VIAQSRIRAWIARGESASPRCVTKSACLRSRERARTSTIAAAPRSPRADRHDPLLRALAPDPDFAGLPVDAIERQSRELRQAQPDE
jgi:hypothetical protein